MSAMHTGKMIYNYHLASANQHGVFCLPPLRLAPIAAQQQQHCQKHQSRTRPVEAGATVTMVQKTAPPHLLWKESRRQSAFVNFRARHGKKRVRKAEGSSCKSRGNTALQNPRI